MSLFFPLKDELHFVDVQFSPVTLPGSRKPYYLKPKKSQRDLDIRGVAAKASVYKVNVAPETIIDVFNASMELMFYLAADGYRIKTPFFTMRLKVPGGFDGTEKTIPDGITAELYMRLSSAAKKYIREHVEFSIDGSMDTEGKIIHVVDEATGVSDTTATRNHILTIKGDGLKVDAEAGKQEMAGVFFVPEDGVPVKVEAIAVNEPLTLKVVVPAALTVGQSYSLAIETQTSVSSNGHFLKEMREMKSSFTVAIR